MPTETKLSLTTTLYPADFQPALRVQQAVTASIEKRILIWMAQRTPEWINPDHLTALGVSAQIGAGACYAWASRQRYALLLSVLCIALNWLGDSLDGTLARVRNQQRPRYGFYVDHMADAFGAVAMMAGLGLSGYLHRQIAMAMLLGFLILSIESYLATYTLGKFRMSHGPFGPTEIRILLAMGTVTLLFHPYATLLGRRFLLFDVGGVIATMGMTVMALSTTFRHGRELYFAERIQ